MLSNLSFKDVSSASFRRVLNAIDVYAKGQSIKMLPDVDTELVDTAADSLETSGDSDRRLLGANALSRMYEGVSRAKTYADQGRQEALSRGLKSDALLAWKNSVLIYNGVEKAQEEG